MDLSPDDEDFQGRLLHQAALWDNEDLLKELIAAGADVDAADSSGRRAIHAAAVHADSACLRALIEAGAAVGVTSDDGCGRKTALHISSERGHATNVSTLLAAGAAIDTEDAMGDTAMVLAARNGHRHVSRILREAQDALERSRLAQHCALRELVLSGDAEKLRAALAALGSAAGILANMTPGGANTLLYLACESGSTQAVQALLEAGADGRAHPVTRYSPLHGAAARGHVGAAKLLLDNCPNAVKLETVERWIPLHAAVIGGHAALVTLLLEYPYPEHVKDTYTDVTGRWRYQAAFDVNATDASGQTALYVACTLGNLAVVDALLSYSVVAEKVPTDDEMESAQSQPVQSPVRSGIAHGIHAIVTKLTRQKSQEPPPRVHPVRPDLGRGRDSCLAAAARGQHGAAVTRLLDGGAAADGSAAPPAADTQVPCGARRSRSAAPLKPGRGSASPSPPRYSTAHRSAPWTALAVAAHGGCGPVCELLAERGAADPGDRALREGARRGWAGLVARLLAAKAYIEPEYKLNKAALSEAVFSSRAGDTALTYSALCPATPVAVNWRELHCQLARIRMSWLRAASLRVNPKLSSSSVALHAITRIDVSNNELRDLPPELFTLLSLRSLNAAQNKLERLPSPSDPFEEDLDSEGRKIKKLVRKSRPDVYSAPVLQELYLQDNRLEELPPSLFSLPALTALDVSNNKLRCLPRTLWRAPALKELNAQLNHLKELPTLEPESAVSPRKSPQSPSGAISAPSSAPPLSSCSAQPFTFIKKSPSSSRAPSLDCSDADPDDVIVTIGNRAEHAISSAPVRAHAWRCVQPEAPPAAPRAPAPPLAALNLAHNRLLCVPRPLACLAPNLQQLNLSYNCLRSMSYVTSYPTSLRQLDLSHNEITCWPSLPQVESATGPDNPLACYAAGAPGAPQGPRPRPRGPRPLGSAGPPQWGRARLLSAACAHRRHWRLDGLRTLILANNLLTRIQLTTDDDGECESETQTAESETDDWQSAPSRLLFPLLSMLDVSCNLLKAVPPSIHHLTNLAVLNLQGNKEITQLPPQMGLLSRLWNLNTSGCNLSEPLASMVNNGRYRSMDVIGYLKSVLEEAHEYRRMKLMVVGAQGIGKTSLLECLRQESGMHHRRRPAEHWSKRMGNKSSRGNMSTVGVDIGSWTYEKARGGKGAVTFRTWDFGGQQEYYATHQYFLSRRSVFLVLWRAVDGRAGLRHAATWLRAVHARAGAAAVIMVATHCDQVPSQNLPPSESPEALQHVIRSTLMGSSDGDRLGLPRVLETVAVSCTARTNVRLLADLIYSVACSVKCPGSKEPLLDQRVPATYIALEEVVTSLAQELPEPVLRHDEYKRLVTQHMRQRFHRSFRDAAELHQATMFLHENGLLLHYEDSTLKELYFLRPQWLCDVLAHVVTVREVNPFAHTQTAGVMRLEDLAHVFKASPALARDDGSALALALLNKFELALCWDARTLLIPPLLPSSEPSGTAPQLLLRSRGTSGASATISRPSARSDSPALLSESSVSVSVGGGSPLRRLLLLSYVPCGFWARLIARVVGDSAIRTANTAYSPPTELESMESVRSALDLCWGWKLWRSGMQLVSGDITLLSVREIAATQDPLLGAIGDTEDEQSPYSNVRLRVLMDGAWNHLEVAASTCVEICLPAEVLVLRRRDGLPIGGYQSVSLEPNQETLAKLLAILADHVDLLLEDWYPSIGTRFVHMSSGRCLITRVVPCPGCMAALLRDRDGGDGDGDGMAQALHRLELNPEPRLRLSVESRASDGDSGVGNESNASSRLGSVEGVSVPVSVPPLPAGASRAVTAWTVEQCALAGCGGNGERPLLCPLGCPVEVATVAPDTMLVDVPPSKVARWEHITVRGIAGRGAFGTVLAGQWRPRSGADQPPTARPTARLTAPLGPAIAVAVKALQPVPPPPGADLQAQHAYKAALSRWSRDPLPAAGRAYCALRQELAVLSRLQHPHVAPLLAVCRAPLALLLELAPLGALDRILRQYRGSGARLSVATARAAALQVARAVEYLHANRVVYRDLKSENVLVWRFPIPGDRDTADGDVMVKLGDYGISRLAPPSGTKGFGGTEGFMAPEIMRFNGEEEYNEKVDCFSFGMLLYELMTLRQPFEGHEAVKECLLDGARPQLTPRDLEYPCSLLEVMRACWSGGAGGRPAGAALVTLLAAPEAAALQDGARGPPEGARAGGGPAGAAAAACVVPVAGDGEDTGPGWEVWLSSGSRLHTLYAGPAGFAAQGRVRAPSPAAVTALCSLHGAVWAGDSLANVTAYDAATCRRLWTVSVQEAVGGAPSPIAALCPLPRVRRVAVALASGRLFLVTSQPPGTAEEAPSQGSFLCTELGTATVLHACVAVWTRDGYSLWCGGDSLQWYSVGADGVRGAETVGTGGTEGTTEGTEHQVRLLAACETAVVAYRTPGTHLYQYSPSTKELVAKLDVSKLAPCSESLNSIAIDDIKEHRVTAMCFVSSQLVVGLSTGTVIVCDLSLRPLTVFRPYGSDCCHCLPAAGQPDLPPMLITVGTDYRPLVPRYVPSASTNSSASTNTTSTNGPYCLLWRTQHWNG